MALLLRVLTYCKQPPGAPMEQRFDPLGGTIGRNADNHFVLPDVSKFISRHHCRIEFSSAEGCYTLTDLGSNASQVSGQTVGNGKTARLKHNDTLMIGDYQLQVIVEEQANTPPAAVLDPFAYQATPSQYAQPPAANFLDQPNQVSNQSGFQDPLSAASILDVGMGSNADPLGFNSLGLGGDPLGGPLGGATSQPNTYRGSESDHLAAHHMPYVAPNVVSRPPAPPAYPQGGLPSGGATIPDDFLSHPAAPAPAWAPPAPAAGGAPVALIPDDFDWLAPAAVAAPAPVAAPAWQAPAPTPPAAPLLGADFDPLGGTPLAPLATPQAQPLMPANFDPLGGTPVGAPASAAPTLAGNFDPLGGTPLVTPAATPKPASNFDPLAPPAALGADFDPLGGPPLGTPAATAKAQPDFDPLGGTPLGGTPLGGTPLAAPVRTAAAAVPVDDLEGTMMPGNRPKPGVRGMQQAAAVAPAAPPVQVAPPPAPIAVPVPPAAPVAAPQMAPVIPAVAQAAAGVAAPAAAPGYGNREVMQALLRGLGVPDLKIKGTDAEMAELVGKMLRGAVSGTMGVLLARSATKREIRIEATMLAQKGNNPMKFFPDPEQAMSQMLTNAWAGYLGGEKAIADAFDDLKAHELATIAGMRAALHGVLERFDPQEIEARLAVPTVMDKMLASNRKAKMWDRMVDLYRQMTSEADDDFQRLFGEKFAAAYEEQTNRLRMSRKL